MNPDQQKRVWDAAYGAAFATLYMGMEGDLPQVCSNARRIASEAVNQLRRRNGLSQPKL